MIILMVEKREGINYICLVRFANFSCHMHKYIHATMTNTSLDNGSCHSPLQKYTHDKMTYILPLVMDPFTHPFTSKGGNT